MTYLGLAECETKENGIDLSWVRSRHKACHKR